MSTRRDFGSIRRLPSGRWQVRYRNDANLLVAASHTFSTKAEASNHLAAIQSDQARGVWVDPTAGQVPFEGYANTWLAERQLRPRTRELYHGLLANHLLPTFGPIPLAIVSSALVRAWHAIRSEATAAVDDQVRKLAASGVGWGEIGRALAVSRQAARQKYRDGGRAR